MSLPSHQSRNFKRNVIVISHVKYVDNPDGTRKGYPTAIGSALSPVIPRYFNSVALAQTRGGQTNNPNGRDRDQSTSKIQSHSRWPSPTQSKLA